MWVMKYECEFIKNMEWVESKRNCINSKQTTDLTLMLPMMIEQIDGIIKLITCITQT